MNKIYKVIVGLLFVFAVLIPAFSTAIDLSLPYLNEPSAIIVQLVGLLLIGMALAIIIASALA